MKSDPAIQRTRDARRRISVSVNDDPAKLVEYYVKMQERFTERLQRGAGIAEQQLPADAQENARR
jgi:hypothetical protein